MLQRRQNRTDLYHHLVVSSSDSAAQSEEEVNPEELLRAAWTPVVPATAAPGRADGRAWRFCCAARFVPERGGAEPAGSGRPAGAPYSSAWRNTL